MTARPRFRIILGRGAGRGRHMTTVAHEDQGDGDDRACFVCGLPVHGGEGVYHADLRIFTHAGGTCDARVDAERRVYDRSARGRWRPRADVLRRLRVTSLAAWRRGRAMVDLSNGGRLTEREAPPHPAPPP